MKYTLQRIAEDLNLSVSTISRVLANKSNVNEQTRDLVLQYMDNHQFSLPQARNALNDANHVVAVIVPDITEDYFAHVVRGIEDILWQNESTMMLCETLEDPKKEAKYIEILKKKKIRNIILATVSKDPDTVRTYLKDGTNYVFFDNLPNTSDNINSVITDNVRASMMAVEHLFNMGYRKIGIIAGKQEETTGFERLMGYRRALEMCGTPVEQGFIAIGDFKEESGYRCMTELLDRNPGMTAVYVNSAKMTYGAIKAIYAKGLRVPQDIAIVGFDVHDTTGLMRPGITSIMQNEVEIGRLCVELLQRQEANVKRSAEVVCQRILLEPRLIIRDSCGCVNPDSPRETSCNV